MNRVILFPQKDIIVEYLKKNIPINRKKDLDEIDKKIIDFVGDFFSKAWVDSEKIDKGIFATIEIFKQKNPLFASKGDSIKEELNTVLQNYLLCQLAKY